MTQLKPRLSEKDHIQGNFNAAIELVEYGDYQCPYCGQAYPIVRKIQEDFGNDLKFSFRNFPLSKIHPQAKMAAVATEAAALQGKFWEMHHIVFENQRRIHETALMEYAQRIGLNISQFEKDLQNYSLVEKVENDFESGLRSGVNATPTFFIDGKKYNGNWEVNNLESFIKRELEAKSIK